MGRQESAPRRKPRRELVLPDTVRGLPQPERRQGPRSDVRRWQFVSYLGSVSRGDLGNSFRDSRPETALLIERLPMTLELSIFALLFATIVGITLGVVSAYRRNSAVDVVTMAFANLGVSIPVFVLG